MTSKKQTWDNTPHGPIWLQNGKIQDWSAHTAGGHLLLRLHADQDPASGWKLFGDGGEPMTVSNESGPMRIKWLSVSVKLTNTLTKYGWMDYHLLGGQVTYIWWLAYWITNWQAKPFIYHMLVQIKIIVQSCPASKRLNGEAWSQRPHVCHLNLKV